MKRLHWFLTLTALALLACTATGSVCRTSHGECRVDTPGKPGWACECHYEYWGHPGVLQ
ncbi:MAG: hypothetical protein O6934_00350 [SAR324 cluster bacterium]|nr:hypothetical protein [SAR324 cluster bacterium]MCZ6645971.1 hypothetical protein [SAR324 cluster bacterium]MCZ6728664.1 hypothetical protein [SAR324 cluster bacterium]